MAVSFKVDWLERRCVLLYEEFVVHTLQREYKYEDLCIFYKEAEFAFIQLKNCALFELMLSKMRDYPDLKQQFTNDYVFDIDVLSTKEIDLICMFPEESKEIFVECIIRSLLKDRSEISSNCTHILGTIDLVNCLKTNPHLLTELEQAIGIISNISKRDMVTVLKMLKQVYNSTPKYNKSIPDVTPCNLFHPFCDIWKFDDLDELIYYLAYELRSDEFKLIHNHGWNLFLDP